MTRRAPHQGASGFTHRRTVIDDRAVRGLSIEAQSHGPTVETHTIARPDRLTGFGGLAIDLDAAPTRSAASIWRRDPSPAAASTFWMRSVTAAIVMT